MKNSTQGLDEPRGIEAMCRHYGSFGGRVPRRLGNPRSSLLIVRLPPEGGWIGVGSNDDFLEWIPGHVAVHVEAV